MYPPQAAQPVGYEQRLGNYLFAGNVEKSFIDKVTAKADVEEIKELMQKDDLERTDLLRLLYLLSAIEIKLCNFGDWDRYLQGKFFAWIRDFVASTELLFDYQDKIKKKEVMVNSNTSIMLDNIRKKMLHNVKFLCDVYLYLGRSTLSLSAVGFDTLTSNRYEYAYPGQYQAPQSESKKGLFNINLGGRR